MSDFGNVTVSKTVNLIQTAINQFLRIKFAEKYFLKINLKNESFNEKCYKKFETIWKTNNRWKIEKKIVWEEK